MVEGKTMRDCEKIKRSQMISLIILERGGGENPHTQAPLTKKDPNNTTPPQHTTLTILTSL